MNEIKFISTLDKLPEPAWYDRHIALTEEGYVYMLTYTPDDRKKGYWSDNEHDSGAVIGWVDGSEIQAAAKVQFNELHTRFEDDRDS
jgi:hypothetical protein